MSLHISEQLYEDMARERFLERICTMLGESYPAARATLAGADARAQLRKQYERAHRYGFTTELDLGRYLITAWILGADFDTRYPAIAEILALNNQTSAQKSEAIEQVTTTLMELLAEGAQ
jgi:hypothetical protein